MEDALDGLRATSLDRHTPKAALRASSSRETPWRFSMQARTRGATTCNATSRQGLERSSASLVRTAAPGNTRTGRLTAPNGQGGPRCPLDTPWRSYPRAPAERAWRPVCLRFSERALHLEAAARQIVEILVGAGRSPDAFDAGSPSTNPAAAPVERKARSLPRSHTPPGGQPSAPFVRGWSRPAERSAGRYGRLAMAHRCAHTP